MVCLRNHQSCFDCRDFDCECQHQPDCECSHIEDEACMEDPDGVHFIGCGCDYTSPDDPNAPATT